MTENTQEDSGSIQEQVQPYINAWHWFVISAVVALFIGYTYLRYAAKEYEATGVILIKDTQAGDGMSELGALEGIGMLGSSFNTVENEIEILQSRRLITTVVHKLKLHTEYLSEGNVKSSLLYRNTPSLLNIVNDSMLQRLEKPVSIKVFPLNESSFKYSIGEAATVKQANYGVPITTAEGLEFFIVPNPARVVASTKGADQDGESGITIRVSPLLQVIAGYKAKITATKSERRGSIVALSVTSPVKEKAEDIIDELIIAYNQDAINDANLVAQNTAQFIDERLRDVKRDLDSVESGLQSFKKERNITELLTESAIGLEKLTGLEGELVDLKTQKSIANALKRNVATSGTDFIPENVGVENGELSAQSAKYNKLLLAYRNQLKYATPENPVVITLKSELDAAKQGIVSSLDTYANQLDIQLSSLNNEFAKTGGKIATVPLSERLNRGIERNRSVIESIYLLLSERREATAISLAITAPKAKIVDKGYAPLTPVSPKPNIIYLACLILGLLIPFGIIYLNGLLYNRIESRRDLERILPNLSILGEVPKLDKNDTDRIVKNDRSILAESFRILRTNLQFKLSTLRVTGRATRILVTSTVKGEGKTFVSYNLAVTLANSGKRVVLVGGDIRNPQIHRYLDKKNKNISGVTEFLTGKTFEIKELLAPVPGVDGLDVILSGAIPPNPAELWMQGRTTELFEQLDSLYDIIVLDSSPTILVTDTLLLKEYADVTVYVARANYTDKPLLYYIKEMVEGSKLNNVGLVINDVKSMNLGYGNKYGYTYNADKTTLLERFKKLFSGDKGLS
jgi:capsular exopolysaccharide synthesis family protein